MVHHKPDGAVGPIGAETDILSLDFTSADRHGTCTIIDTGNPSNNKVNVPIRNVVTLQAGSSVTPTMLQLDATGLWGWSDHNLMLQSQTFDDAGWSKDTGVSVTADATTAPDGTMTADKITNASSSTNRGVTSAAVTVVNGAAYVTAFRLKYFDSQWIFITVDSTGTPSGSAWFDIQNGVVGTVAAGLTAAISSLGNGWYLCTVIYTQQDTGRITKVARASADASTTSGTGSYYIWGGQINRGVTLLTYYPTTTNIFIDLPIGWFPTWGKYGLLLEDSQTNLTLWGSDFTNAAWTKTNMTAAFTATNPEGRANQASTLTATAANATALQNYVNASNTRRSSCVMRRRTGTGAVDITNDNGSTWTTVTLTDKYTLVLGATQQSITNPTVGVRIQVSGDAVDVAWFNSGNYSGTSNSNYMSPIPTFGVSAARNAGKIEIAVGVFPWNINAGTFFINTVTNSAIGTGVWSSLGDGTSTGFRLLLQNATSPSKLAFGPGNGSAQITTPATYGADVPIQYSSSYDASGFAISVNGDGPVTSANTGVPENVPTNLMIGGRNRANAGGSDEKMSVPIFKFVYVPRRVANADLVNWRYRA